MQDPALKSKSWFCRGAHGYLTLGVPPKSGVPPPPLELQGDLHFTNKSRTRRVAEVSRFKDCDAIGSKDKVCLQELQQTSMLLPRLLTSCCKFFQPLLNSSTDFSPLVNSSQRPSSLCTSPWLSSSLLSSLSSLPNSFQFVLPHLTSVPRVQFSQPGWSDTSANFPFQPSCTAFPFDRSVWPAQVAFGLSQGNFTFGATIPLRFSFQSLRHNHCFSFRLSYHYRVMYHHSISFNPTGQSPDVGPTLKHAWAAAFFFDVRERCDVTWHVGSTAAPDTATAAICQERGWAALCRLRTNMPTWA